MAKDERNPLMMDTTNKEREEMVTVQRRGDLEMSLLGPTAADLAHLCQAGCLADPQVSESVCMNDVL